MLLHSNHSDLHLLRGGDDGTQQQRRRRSTTVTPVASRRSAGLGGQQVTPSLPERNRKYCCDVTREPEVLPSNWNWKCYRIVWVRTGSVIVTSHGNRKHCRQTETGSAYVSCGRRAALPRIGWG